MLAQAIPTPDHRAQQQPRVPEHEDRQEPERAAGQADRVGDLAVGPPGQRAGSRRPPRPPRRCRCRSRPPPSWRPRCRAPRWCRWCRRVAGHRRCGVDPHGEEREPGEELDPRQLLHGVGHVLEIVQDGDEAVVVPAAPLQQPPAISSRPTTPARPPGSYTW